jgi:hypothetical protein
MDVATAIFVGLLCLAAFFVTTTIRRDFRTRERLRREQARALRNPRRKP